MSTIILGDTQEEIDSKKRKMSDEAKRLKTQITSYFKLQPKMAKSPPALRKSTYTSSTSIEVTEDSNDLVYIGSSITYLYLMVDVSPDRDYIGRYRVVLSRLFSAMKSTNLNVVIILYESTPVQLDDEFHCSCSLCINQLNKVSRSVI